VRAGRFIGLFTVPFVGRVKVMVEAKARTWSAPGRVIGDLVRSAPAAAGADLAVNSGVVPP
jgi:hypothetical protein